MKPLRNARCFSALVALLAGCAWLLASNHCALAALRSISQPGHSCCQAEPAPGPKAPPAMQCCEAFNVPVPAAVVVPAGEFHELKSWGREADFTALAAPKPPRENVELGQTGPPPAASFAGAVLRQSFRAHAPPFFVA